MLITLAAALGALFPAFAEAPPVPVSAAAAPPVYEYRGPDGSGAWPVDELLALVRAHPSTTFEVRGPGAPQWTAWNQVPALAMGWLEPQGNPVYTYWPGEGEPVSLGAADLAARVHATPGGTHLVWKPGLSGWTDAEALPSLQPALANAGHGGTAPVSPTGAHEAASHDGGSHDAMETGADHASSDAGPHASGSPEMPSAHPDGAPDCTATDCPMCKAQAAPSGLHVTLGGDVRLGATADHLERLSASGEGAPSAGFVVSRARPIVDVALGKWLAGRVAIEFGQDDSTVTLGAGDAAVDLKSWAAGWSVQGREIFLEAHAGTTFHHRFRLGLQESAFGVRDRYERDYAFAGTTGRKDLARRAGLVPDEDLGIGWRGEAGDELAFDLQLLNGSGGTTLDDNTGKDLVARVEASPVKAVRGFLSAEYGARGPTSDGNQLQGELAVEVRGAAQRLMLEGLVGSTTEDPLDTWFSGVSATGEWDVPVHGDALTSVDLVGRFQFFDPVAGLDTPDAWWTYDAGLWADWKVYPGQNVRTGVTWEMYTPQDLDLPATQTVVAEAAWRF
jgi:hypothetical protein